MGGGNGRGEGGADLSAAINQTVDSISPPFAAPPARSGVDSSWQRLLFTTPPFVLAVNPLSVPVSQSHKLPVNQFSILVMSQSHQPIVNRLSVPVSQGHKTPVNPLSVAVSQSHQPPVNPLSVPVSQSHNLPLIRCQSLCHKATISR